MTARGPLIIGTRGSALALAQARLVQEALSRAYPGVAAVIKEIKTVGDRRLDLSLTQLAPGAHGYETGGAKHERLDPGLFTKELEMELLAGTITVAVHSLKDLPTAMPAGLTLAAVLPRANTADVLVYKPGGAFEGALPMLPHGAVVATSSLRRQRQLLWRRPDLRVTEVRGNVGTRLQKLRDREDWTALVLARAGLDRLGHAETLRHGHLETAEAGRFAAETLGPDVMLPAVGQGAIGLQTRAEDAERFAGINCAETMTCVTAERDLLSRLGGGCQMPLGVSTQIEGESLLMAAVLFRDGSFAPCEAVSKGEKLEPGGLALAVAEQLIDAGNKPCENWKPSRVHLVG